MSESAFSFAARLLGRDPPAARLTERIGQITCEGDHRHCAPHCDDCGMTKPCWSCGAAV